MYHLHVLERRELCHPGFCPMMTLISSPRVPWLVNDERLVQLAAPSCHTKSTENGCELSHLETRPGRKPRSLNMGKKKNAGSWLNHPFWEIFWERKEFVSNSVEGFRVETTTRTKYRVHAPKNKDLFPGAQVFVSWGFFRLFFFPLNKIQIS